MNFARNFFVCVDDLKLHDGAKAVQPPCWHLCIKTLMNYSFLAMWKWNTKWFTARWIDGKPTKTLKTSEVVIICCMHGPGLAQPKDLWFVSNQSKDNNKALLWREKAEGTISYQPSCGCPPAGTGPWIWPWSQKRTRNTVRGKFKVGWH